MHWFIHNICHCSLANWQKLLCKCIKYIFYNKKILKEKKQNKIKQEREREKKREYGFWPIAPCIAMTTIINRIQEELAVGHL